MTPPAPRPRYGVLLVVLGVLVVVRAAQVRIGAAPDEGGFLVVASQWHAHGSSLYGDYWVDRPPLLITLFQVADVLGGLYALRVLGALLAAVAVALLWSTSWRLYGRRAADWTAVVAAALLVTPLYGAVDVNGELLALPFLALGVRLAVEAVVSERHRVAWLSALGAGAAAMAAVQVKQNLADVVVFTAMCWLVSWRAERLTGRRLTELIGLAALGAGLAYAVVMAWSLAHGTSPAEAYQATYPFRLDAARVIAVDGRVDSGIRLGNLLLAFLVSIAPLVLLAAAGVGFRHPRHPGVVWALAVTFGYGSFSVLAGGSYWLHYLVETVPVVALAAGVVAEHHVRLVRPLGSLLVVSALVGGGWVVVNPTPTPGTTVGDAIKRVDRPGDTVVSVLGDADILRATGQRSPYPYLWSLPSRTLDPDMAELRDVLAGRDAPAWVVVRGPRTMERLGLKGVTPTLTGRYRHVTTICSRLVFLRDDLQRAAPRGPAVCD